MVPKSADRQVQTRQLSLYLYLIFIFAHALDPLT